MKKQVLPGQHTWLLRMSLLQLVLAICFISAATAANMNAQELLGRKVTVYATDEEIGQVLRKIEKQTDVRFVFSSKLIQSNRKISFSADAKPLAEVLSELLTPQGLVYQVKGKNIVVKPGEKTGEASNLTESVTLPASDAEITVKGKITDAQTSEGLPGVNVLVKGTQTGTSSDVNGNYSIQVPDGNATLVFSFVGYTSHEANIGSQTQINVSLKTDNKSLEEIVVVGYGTVKKSDVTGSVSSIKSQEITAYPALGTVQALQGRAAGVQIQANNGEPGSTFKVRVRGGSSINASSDPIYVVDGFVGGTLPPPEDIESIEVLKDASATAIYGSRGANGVIMVTTKKGVAGKPRI